MGTTAQKLAYLQQTKEQLKSAIEAQVSKSYITYSTSPVGDDFRSFVTFINELPVGSNLSTGAHSNNNNIIAVNIPSNFSEVSDDAFRRCYNLTSVTMAEGVKHLGARCFQQTPITSIVIPSSVESIGRTAFSGCANLTSVTIPGSVKSIDAYAFNDCTSLAIVTFQEGLESIGDYSFQNAKISTITIPKSIKSIGNQAFRDCNSLASTYYNGTMEEWCNISFGGSYFSTPTEYSHNLYINGEPLTEIVIPNSITEIKDSCFVGLTGISSVSIPNGVTSIGHNFLYGCTGFSTFTLPEGIESIGNYFCKNCTSLVSLSIPSTVKSIGYDILYSSTNMTSITVLPTEPPTLGSRYCFSGSYPIYVPAESVDAYKSATNWSYFASRIQAIPQ